MGTIGAAKTKPIDMESSALSRPSVIHDNHAMTITKLIIISIFTSYIIMSMSLLLWNFKMKYLKAGEYRNASIVDGSSNFISAS